MLHTLCKPLITIVILSSPLFTQAQSTFIPHNSPAADLIDRYEVRTGHLRNDIFTDLQPYNRKDVADFISSLDTIEIEWSEVDRFNLAYLRSDNLPWSDTDIEDSESPFLRYFYKSKANMYQVHEDRFTMFVNPGLYLQAGPSALNDELLYTNTRSAEIRGVIDNKVGFYTYISENQIRPADHEKDFREKTRSYPGAHFTKSFGDDGVDFFKARGYISFQATPSIGLQFGHDRNFIGNGYRSLLLSDFAPDYTFLKVNTKVWRFQYQNIFAHLTDRAGFMFGQGNVRPNPSKYASIHYLSLDVLDNLTIGLFEAVTFHDNQGTGRGFDVHYLNPIIFYRSIEHQLGDPDKMLVGLNLRYLPVQRVEVYGQFMLNEFRINDLRARNGHHANKYGSQIGARYVDAFTISNLDLRAEYNRVRPYSYTHYDISRGYPVNNWTHYNHALAHPLGANFYEWIGSIEYQPFPKITTGMKVTHAIYGTDDDDSNWGQDIFKSYRDHEQELGNTIGQGIRTQLDIAQFWITWQVRHNLFLELDTRYRSIDSEIEDRSNENWFAGITLRLNQSRRGWGF